LEERGREDGMAYQACLAQWVILESPELLVTRESLDL
jgi:hypothetical protein